ncbi:hypothetical protein L6164_029610 [Bauhinia variegata]|uniref:Uncharacterized protein n=1 Tax=Bauhinia variegata TaxID=167791 RepID=A0ACB9LA45_BAUVA|nr:hypothetical protein L6164_029610 [Bauhinia variegata]
MGACLSKKKGSSSVSSPVAAAAKSDSAGPAQASAELKSSGYGITVSKPKVEADPDVNVKKIEQEKQDPVQEDEGQVKKEIFIIKHRKSHDGRDRKPKSPPAQQDVAQPASDGLVSASTSSSSEAPELMGNKMAPGAAAMSVGVRTSSCSKEEVDAILIQCGRLSRSSSSKAASSSIASGERRRRYSGSKRSYDFDHCENDTTSADDDQKKANAIDNSDLCEDEAEKRHQHRQRHRQSPKPSSQGRRRTPSRERDQHQRSSSRERRVSRSPGRRASETTNSTNNASANASNNSNNGSARRGKMVSVPATISSLTMDKSNNVGGGGESAVATGIKRISVKRNVGDNGIVGSRAEASPRSQSPARTNGNAANAKVSSDNQQQPSLSRNSSRKAEKSPHRRNPLSEIDLNSLAYPQTENNNGTREQSRIKREIQPEVNQKPNADMNDNTRNKTTSRVTLDKGVTLSCKTNEHPEEEKKVLSSMTENIVKTVVPSGIDNLKPQTLTRSRSARRSRDLDFNPEAMLNPDQSYTSLLLEDIQNFHQKIAPPVSLPACVTKACSILEAVADLNSTTSANLSGAFSEDRRSLGAYHHGKRMPDTKDPFVESEVAVSDDVMEPSMQKYVTVRRGSLGAVDSEDQESSGSNSFTISGNQCWGMSSSSWEPNSADSKDCWTSRLNSREEGQKSTLGLGGSLSAEAGRDMDETRKRLNSKRRDSDHQNSSGIGRGRLDATKGLHAIPVVTAAAST